MRNTGRDLLLMRKISLFGANIIRARTRWFTSVGGFCVYTAAFDWKRAAL